MTKICEACGKVKPHKKDARVCADCQKEGITLGIARGGGTADGGR